MIWSVLLINNLEYAMATLDLKYIFRPWTIVIIIFLVLVVYLVDWSSKKVDKFLKGDDKDE